MKPLHGIKVLDLSHRLPGPLGGKLLADQGAEVVKFEDATLKDAFLDGFFGFDDSFADWYQGLNAAKKVVRTDFKGPEASAEMKRWVDWADIVLMGLSDKLATKLGVGPEDLAKLAGPKVVLGMGASQNGKTAMHDLNALAETGLLELHVAGQTQTPLAPPFLPVAGIAFGQQIALSALAYLTQAQREKKCVVTKVFMQEEINSVFAPFWSQRLRAENRTKFLHNGAYPCYCLYKSSDGDWVAVAAVEEKFWHAFNEALKLGLTPEQRFSTEPHVFNQVARAIAQLSTSELDKLLVSKDICVSLITHRA